MRVTAFILLAILLTTVAVRAGPSNVAPTVFIAGEGTVTVAAGQTFLIALDSNPTTGYSWSALPGFDAAVVTVVGSSYRGPDRALPGAGGTQIVVLRALAPGTTKLRLGYARPFERGIPPVKRAEFSIRVR